MSAIGRGRMKHARSTKGTECDIPAKPGIYRIVDSTGVPIYVGQSNNLRARAQQHVSSGRLELGVHRFVYSAAVPTASKDDLCASEKAHIARHKPAGNKTCGGNGRR